MRNGWIKFDDERLGNCLYYPLNSKLTVSASLYQNSYLADTVTITEFLASTDGNYLCSLKALLGQPLGIILCNHTFTLISFKVLEHGKPSREYEFEETIGLSAIRTHTANLWYAGTAGILKMSILYEQAPTNHSGWFDVSNDRWAGYNNIHKGKVIENARKQLVDLLDFHPSSHDIRLQISFSSRGINTFFI